MIRQTPTATARPVVLCPYCGCHAHLATGREIYRRKRGLNDLSDQLFWSCAPCGARVGCRPGTETPIGRLANQELRNAKQDAHYHFDRLHRFRFMSKSDAYGWLAREMGLSQNEAYISLFDLAQCQRVIELAKNFEARATAAALAVISGESPCPRK